MDNAVIHSRQQVLTDAARKYAAQILMVNICTDYVFTPWQNVSLNLRSP
jgi:hypothetical protein